MKNKIRQLADDYKEYDLTPVDTPATTKKLNPGSSADDPGTAPLTSDYPYRQLLGSLSFIALNARPDIAYAVNQCARFANEPTVLCWQALTRILAYLVHTIDYAIVFRRDHKHTRDVEVYSDSDHMGSYNSKGELRSVTGYAIFHKGNLIAFKAQTQKRPSQSSSESELYAGVAACKQALYVQNLLAELDGTPPVAYKLYGDNDAMLLTNNRDSQKSRLRHIEARYWFTRDQVQAMKCTLHRVDSADNPADIFTKPLPPAQFTKLLSMLMARNLTQF